MRKLTNARTMDAKIPAKVPSTLTAPSVPLGTTLNVVTRYLDIMPDSQRNFRTEMLKKHKVKYVHLLEEEHRSQVTRNDEKLL